MFSWNATIMGWARRAAWQEQGMKLPLVLAGSCLGLSLAGCGSTRAPASPSATAPMEVGEHGVRGALLARPQAFLSLEQYKVELARRITANAPDLVFQGQPPMPLKGILVVRIRVERDGSLQPMLLRSNGFSVLEERALQSVRRLARMAPPHPAWLDGRGRLDITETWLFNRDDRFQLRSLAQEQALE